MILWIIIGGILIVAFSSKVLINIQRRKRNRKFLPDIDTRNKRYRFINRFRHLEGVGE